MTNLTLTIIVPIYNVEKYLGQCLDSLISKKCTGKYQVFLVDDCGQDSSIQIAKRYIDMYPNIFKLIKNEVNKGLSGARNSALSKTETKYVMFVDSDDWISEGAIEQLLNVITNNQPDFLFFDFTREWKSKSVDIQFIKNVAHPKIINDDLYPVFLQRISVTAWGKVLKTETAKRFYFPEGIIFEDVAVIPLITLKSNLIFYCPGIRYHYRQREGSIMANRRGEVESLFIAYNVLISHIEIITDTKTRQDLMFILTRNWLAHVRVAYNEKNYNKTISLLNNGVSFFNQNYSKWHKSNNLISHLGSESYFSKVKVKVLLSLLKKKYFTSIFLLHISYTPMTFNNIKPLILESYKSKRGIRTTPNFR